MIDLRGTCDNLFTWAERHERWLFSALLALVILPIWLFPYFPAWDSPLHLNIADMMANYGRPGHENLSEYLVRHQAAEPNLASQYLLLLFATFTDPYVGEKLLLTLYALVLGLGARYAVRVVNPQASVVSLLFIPGVFTMFVHRGLYNFSLSTALFPLVYAFWFERRMRMTPWTLGLMGLLGLLLVFVHLLGFVVLALSIGATCVYDAVHAATRAEDASGRRAAVATLLRRALGLGCAFLPAAAVVMGFFIRHGVEGASARDQDRLDLLMRLGTMDHLYSFTRIEVAIFAPFVALVIFLFASMLRRRVWTVGGPQLSASDGLAFSALVLVAIYFFMPITTKSVEVSERLLPFLFGLGFLWLSTLTPGRLAGRLILVVVTGASLATTANRMWQYDRLNGFLEEYISAEAHIRPGATVLPIHFWRMEDPNSGPPLIWRTDPLYHAAGHIGVSRNVVNLRNLFLSPEVLGYFPLRYRDELDPYVHIGRDIDGTPPEVDFLEYSSRTGGDIDYVLVMAGSPLHAIEGEEAARVAAQLEAGYELIYTSPGHGFARLYRNRAADPKVAGQPTDDQASDGSPGER